jgi:hypothetical protein
MATQRSQRNWLILTLTELQLIAERILLVGAAIAIRKVLEQRVASSQVRIDNKVRGRLVSRLGTNNSSVFQPSSRN